MKTETPKYPIIESIIGSWRIEGLEIDPETIRCMQNLTDGLISLEDAIKTTKQRLIYINSNP